MSGPNLHATSFDTACSRVTYEATYFAAMWGMMLGWSLRSTGRQHIPATGPALLVANHQSFIDPALVGLGTRRHLCYLARKTLFKNRAFAWLIRMLNAVPIDQEGVGKDGIKAILEQLQLGQAVVVFPEGNRTSDGNIAPLKAGIHLLIKRTQAPIVPVGIAGAYDAWPRWRKYPIPAPLFMPANRGCIAVSIGKPLEARRFAEMGREESMRELHGEIMAQWRKAENLRRKA
ncbi:MAG TPA: lysophospholipid acyltransferase family protein [Gemmataceae bacterium]|nr:lysophospholipid acyltransferase family protein [Gemmataceae bacterium]